MADKKKIPFMLLNILMDESSEDHILTTVQLIQRLDEKYGLKAERRTIYANIRLLQELGYDISDHSENGKGTYLKGRSFSQGEILTLCNAVHASHYISDQESRTLIHKLLNLLPKEQRKAFVSTAYLPNPKKTENQKLMEHIKTISKAIEERKEISFVYLEYDEKKNLKPRRKDPYVVQPRFFLAQESRMYLIVTSSHHPGFIHYRLDRISSIEVTDTSFASLPEDLDAYEYSRNMYFMFNGEKTAATLRCSKHILDYMIDIFGQECSIIPNGDQYDIHVNGYRKGLLLLAEQYMDAMEIIAPEDLRNDFQQLLSEAAEKYSRQ